MTSVFPKSWPYCILYVHASGLSHWLLFFFFATCISVDQLVSTPLSSVQCSCCVYWPVPWLVTSWTGKWRSVRRKMQMHKQRKGMRKVQWLLFRLRHCFASYRMLYSSPVNSTCSYSCIHSCSLAVRLFWHLSPSANQIPQRETE